MSSIRGVSVGGNLYDVTDTTNIAPKEPTGYASREYQVGRTFIMADGLLYKATAQINVGDAIVVNSNAERTNVDELFEATENVEAIPTMLNELGAKNLLPNNATTQIQNGVTFTVNSDGSVRTSGTGNAESWFILCSSVLKAGRYILSGCPNGGGNNFRIYLSNTDTSTVLTIDTGSTATFEINETVNYQAVISVIPNINMDGKVFYPMIRPASIADDTYVPYAKTNRELTTQLSGAFLQKVVTYNYTLSGIITNGDFAVPTIDGYSFMGIIGVGSNHYVECVVNAWPISKTRVRYGIRDMSNTISAIAVYYYLLYVRNDLAKYSA